MRSDTVASLAERLIAVLACARIDADSCVDFDALLDAIAKDIQVIREGGMRVMLASGLAQSPLTEMST